METLATLLTGSDRRECLLEFETFENSDPAKDVCGFCKRHLNQISISKDKTEEQKLVTNLPVHKLRAKQFYKLLNENLENAITFCFDLQQVQSLPRVPISKVSYAQQLPFYAFCVTDVTTRHPVFYTWTENRASRGSVEISSALLDFVRNVNIPEDVSTIQSFR
ncbi:hypothetical protein ILUMI_15924 [Ignelater luminosus]|uniref:Uncharacterized protein n=1 Tax=Ignelater luminosus TaxID=2038154 RepID=A0A8K0G8N1_IGNLU|nr:hypothetical protein ILUMI_15924 [Ignelater luminosus]